MRGVSAQAAAMQANMGRMSGSYQNVLNPANQLVDSFHRQQIGMRDLGKVATRSRSIWEQQTRMMNAMGMSTFDAAGNARVMMTQMGGLGEATFNAGARLRLFNTFLNAGAGQMVKWGKNMQWAGRQLTVGFTVPLMFLGSQANKFAEEYDRNMTRIIKVSGDAADANAASVAEFTAVENSIKRQTGALVEYGAQMGFTAAETTSAIAEFAQMGYAGAALDQLTKAATRLSRVSGTDLQTSIEGTRLVAQAFGIELDKLTETFAKLNIVENNTALSLDELMVGLPVVAAVSNTVGMSIEETAGMMAMMKEGGISGKEGATALRTGLLQLVQDATIPTRNAFQALGLDIDDMKQRMNMDPDNPGSPLVFFDQLANHMDSIRGNQVELNKFAAALSKLFGVRQTSRILQVVDGFNERTVEGSVAQRAFLGATTEATEAMRIYEFEQRLIDESAAGIADRLRAELNVELTKLGENFLEVTNSLRETAVSIIRWFNGLDDGVKRVVLGLGGLIAILGPIVMVSGLLANAFGQILRLTTAILPKTKLLTMAEVAQRIAFQGSTEAIISETGALIANAAAKDKVTIATARAIATEAGLNIPGLTGPSARLVGRGNLTRMMDPATGGVLNRAGRQAAGFDPAITRQGGVVGSYGPSLSEVSRRGQASMRGFVGGRDAAKATEEAMRGFRAMFRDFTTRMSTGLRMLAPEVVTTVGAGISGAFARTRVRAGRMAAGAGDAVATAGGAVRGFARTAGQAIGRTSVGKGAAALGAAAVGAPAAAAGIAALVAAVLAIPILADPKAFFASFKSAIAGPLNALKATFATLQNAWNNLMAQFKQAGSSGGGIGQIASLFGAIAGYVGGVLVNALNTILGILNILIDAVSVVFNLFRTIGEIWEAITSGDVEGLGSALAELAKSVGRLIVGIVASIMDALATIVSVIPVVGDDMAEGLMRGADAMRNWDALAADVNTKLSETERILQGVAEAQEEIAGEMEEGADYIEQMVKARIIDKTYLDGALDQNNNIKESFIEQLRSNEKLTDEMKNQILMQVERQRITAALAELEQKIVDAERLRESGGADDLDTRRKLEEIERKKNQLLDEQANLVDRMLYKLTGQVRVGDELVDTWDDVGESIDDATNNLEQFASTWTGALKSGINEVMGDIATAVMDHFQAEQDAVMAVFDSRAEAIDKEFERRNEALDAQQQAEEEALEQRHSQEIDAIESAADARIEALEAEAKVDEDRERQRERAFEREKARISYLHDMRTGNINMQLAIARGELSSAAIMREEISASQSNFYAEEAERERGYIVEDRDRARKAEIDMIQETSKARLDALKAEQDAEAEALKASHDARRKQMEQEKRFAEERLKNERAAAEAGFKAREREISRTIDVWKRTTPATEAEHRRHVDQLSKDLGLGKQEWDSVVRRYADLTGKTIGEGFQTGEQLAVEALGEESKWKQHAEDIVAGLGQGFAEGVSDSFRAVAEMFGVKIPAVQGAKTAGHHHHADKYGFYHTGGLIRNGGGRGIKADEKHAVLQTGEYVVQRKAVSALGPDTLERINQAHRGELTPYFHDGGPVDWQSKLDGKSTPVGAGGVFGRYMSYLAAHGGMPTGMGAIGNIDLSGFADLIPPDYDATWRHGDWRTGLAPDVINTVASVLARIPGGQRITSALRPGARVAGSGRVSQHALGRAVDIGVLARSHGGTPESDREGDMIAAAFRAMPNVGQVLWKTMTGGNHYNHVHVGFKHDGGLIEDQPDFTTMNLGNNLPNGLLGSMMGGLFNVLASSMAGVGYAGMGGAAEASGPIKTYAKQLLANYGWGPEHWGPLHSIVSRESSWNPNAQNPTSTAYGLGQFLDQTWSGAGGRKTSDPYEQIRLMYNYIQGRYGNPSKAWDFWQRNNYYHGGGLVGNMSIPQLARGGRVNYDNVVANLHKRETVLTSSLSSSLERGIKRLEAGDYSVGETHVHIENFHGTEDNIEQLARRLEVVNQRRAVRRGERRRFG